MTTRDITAGPPSRGPLPAARALLWLAAAAVTGIAVARVAVWAEQVRAPLLVFPLLVGCLLGLGLVGVMRLTQFGHRPTLLLGAALAAVAAIVGEHYFSYRDARAALLAPARDTIPLETLPEILPPAAKSFTAYMQRQAAEGRPITAAYSLRGGAAWASWAADGVLLFGAVLAIVFLAARTPYCSACRSWYRTVRRGFLNGDAARSIAVAAGLPADSPTATADYRLSHCAAGCGPARLELAWSDARSQSHRMAAWLAPAERERVVRVLDAAATTPETGGANNENEHAGPI